MLPEGTVIVRVLIGTALGFALGFERGLRGSPAGDRTFSLVGASAAAVTAVFYQHSPQTVAGVVTGIGFIGGGVVLHGEGTLVRGITTAATVFATAAIGILVGAGDSPAAAVLTALLLVVLEIRYISALRYVNSQHYRSRFRQENEPRDRQD
jgi:putative Mg2+ transporter-C (MgtC) family protein